MENNLNTGIEEVMLARAVEGEKQNGSCGNLEGDIIDRDERKVI